MKNYLIINYKKSKNGNIRNNKRRKSTKNTSSIISHRQFKKISFRCKSKHNNKYINKNVKGSCIIRKTFKTTSTLDELFPNLQLVEFKLEITEEFPQDDQNLTNLKLKYYCSQHDGKYANFFCYNCDKSICNDCLCSGMHMNHKIKEKYDYLQSSKTLVEIMFQGLNEIFNNVKG